jgi:hypothetical protein
VYRWAKACDTTLALREITMEIQSTDLKKAIIEATKINPSAATIPNKLSDVVVPVIDVSPAHNRVCEIVRAASAVNATSTTIYTTPTDKDFYLTAASISTIKDVTATSLASFIETNIGGAARQILYIIGLTLTVQSGQTSISFPVPIKIDRGVNIIIAHTTNVANVSSRGLIYGYTVDNF